MKLLLYATKFKKVQSPYVRLWHGIMSYSLYHTIVAGIKRDSICEVLSHSACHRVYTP